MTEKVIPSFLIGMKLIPARMENDMESPTGLSRVVG